MDELASKLFRIRRTVFEILHDRGYLVTEGELHATKDDFREQFGDDPRRDDLTMLKHKRGNPSEEIYVFFPPEVMVGVKHLQSIFEKMKEGGVKRAMLVLQTNLSDLSKNTLEDMAMHGYMVEVFQEAELLVNVAKHELVALPLISLHSPSDLQLAAAMPPHHERGFERLIVRDVGGEKGNNHYLYRHANGIVLVGLAPDHALFHLLTSTTVAATSSNALSGVKETGVTTSSAAGDSNSLTTASPAATASVTAGAATLDSPPARPAPANANGSALAVPPSPPHTSAVAAVTASAANEGPSSATLESSANTAGRMPEVASEAESKEEVAGNRDGEGCGGIELTVDFNVGKKDRTTMHAQGKSKQNATWLDGNSPLCRIEGRSQSQLQHFIIRCCVHGCLLEVNTQLISNPSLLLHKAQSEGYVAALLTRQQDWEKIQRNVAKS